jgi:hypothetical protein
MKPRQTELQRIAGRQLREIAENNPDALVLHARPELDGDGQLLARIRLPTGELLRQPGGLPVNEHEDVTIFIGSGYPLVPPVATVDHRRFAGHPHVLQGTTLCVYLDPSREWSTTYRMVDYIERLWQWFADAAANRFSATDALYHAVGGVLHETRGNPMIVVRSPLPTGSGVHPVGLLRRTPDRFDLVGRTDPAASPASLISLSDPLYYGAGLTLGDLLQAVQPSEGVLTALGANARRVGAGEAVHFVLAVPNPATGRPHILAADIGPDGTDLLQRIPLTASLDSLPPALTSSRINWHPVSDDRLHATTRRDAQRPAAGFHGKAVLLLGCGGLGSWIGEYLVRAGVESICLSDPGLIRGGLLVRQNFTEIDIGRDKATALRDRLAAIHDDLVADSVPGRLPPWDHEVWQAADVIIDATVANVIGEVLDATADDLPQETVLARVATDVGTATLGLLTVSSGIAGGLDRAEAAARQAVRENGSLEAFATFWEPAIGNEVVPEPGCSVPTFHGAATDVAGVAAILTNLLGQHVEAAAPGTHLVAMPGTPTGAPAHTFVAGQPATDE